MKLLGIVLSFLFGKMNSRNKGIKESALEVFEEVSRRSRKVAFLSVLSIGAISFFCGGLFISIANGTAQYDSAGIIYWSSTFITGLVVSFLAACILAYVFLVAWPGANLQLGASKNIKKEETIHVTEHTSPLEHALSLLIMDFVKEREHRRHTPTATTTPNESYSSDRESHSTHEERSNVH